MLSLFSLKENQNPKKVLKNHPKRSRSNQRIRRKLALRTAQYLYRVQVTKRR